MARAAPVAVATPVSRRMHVHLALALVWAVGVCVPGGVAQMSMPLPPLLVTIYYNHDTSGGTSGCTGPVSSIDIHAIETPPSLQGGCLLQQVSRNQTGCRMVPSSTRRVCSFLAGTDPTTLYGCTVPPSPSWLLRWSHGCTGAEDAVGQLTPQPSASGCATAAGTQLDVCANDQCFSCLEWADVASSPTARPTFTALAACPIFGNARPLITSTVPRGGRGTFIANRSAELSGDCPCATSTVYHLPSDRCSLQRVPIECGNYRAGSTGCGNPCLDCVCIDLATLQTPPPIDPTPWDLHCPGAVTMTTTTVTERLTRAVDAAASPGPLPVCALQCPSGQGGACRQRGTTSPDCLNVTRDVCAAQNFGLGWGQSWSFCAAPGARGAAPVPARHSCIPVRDSPTLDRGSCCDASTWEVDLTGYTCVDGYSSTASTATACADKCCQQSNCTGWQWCSGLAATGCRRGHCKLFARTECAFVTWDPATTGDPALTGFVGRSLGCGRSTISCPPTHAPTTVAPPLGGVVQPSRGRTAVKVSVGGEVGIAIGLLLVLCVAVLVALYAWNREQQESPDEFDSASGHDTATSLLINPAYAEIAFGGDDTARTDRSISGNVAYSQVVHPYSMPSDVGVGVGGTSQPAPIYATAGSGAPIAVGQPAYVNIGPSTLPGAGSDTNSDYALASAVRPSSRTAPSDPV
eukprot:m.158910 g.158910  ORF g.158910 m.158910 type:complete len:691 (-) comp23708_c0_seq2:48-2120(-)